jgi:ATP-dependent protease ClpP protease subunit
VLAVCSQRAAMPSTRFTLREPTTHADVHVRNAAQWADLRTDERQRFCARLAAATGQSIDRSGADLTRGHFMNATEAVTYGLLDEVCRPEAAIHQMPSPPIGFRPRR